MSLELTLQELPKKYNIFPRKLEVDGDNIFLYGPPSSGKTTLLHKFLWDIPKQYKAAFVDFNDWRLGKLNFAELVNFIKIKEISHIAIDNAPPNIHKIDGVKICAATRAKPNSNFESFNLSYLDFEEFAATEKHGTLNRSIDNAAGIFGHFTLIGNMPEKLSCPDAKRVEFSQKFAASLCTSPSEQALLFELSTRQSHLISLLQIYSLIKAKTKISKDLLYEKVKIWSDWQVFALIEKFESPKAPKKLCFSDFAIPSALSATKDFGRLFENAVFCELDKEDIYYLDAINFYYPNEKKAILTRPFDDAKMLEIRAKKALSKSKNYEIEKLEIITMHTSFETKIDNVEVVAMPFLNFAMQK